MLALVVLACLVSAALVAIFSVTALVWSLGMLFAANGFPSMPDSFMFAYGTALLGCEWLCTSVVNGFIARKWFPHVRGGVAVVVVIAGLLVSANALVFWSPFAPEAFFSGAMLDSGGLHAAASIRSASPVLVASEAAAARPPSSLRSELAFFMALFAGLLAASWAGLSALIIGALYALPGRKWRHRDVAVRLAAVESHRDRAVLRWVAAHDQDSAVRLTAQARLRVS